jgi:hypothetical protein
MFLDLEQQLRLHGHRCLDQYRKHGLADRAFLWRYFEPARSQRENACDLFRSLADEQYRIQMTYFILARDGTSRIVLKRENREAAVKRVSLRIWVGSTCRLKKKRRLEDRSPRRKSFREWRQRSSRLRDRVMTAGAASTRHSLHPLW